jgi:hypothetical protein
MEGVEQWEITFRDRFADPVAAMRPVAVVQNVWQMCMQYEYKVS